MSWGVAAFSIVHFLLSSAGSLLRKTLTRRYLPNAGLILTKPAASEAKHLSFLSTGRVSGCPREPRSAGTQVPYIKGTEHLYE